MANLITVFGATGNQGGSVIDAILKDPQLSKEFKIRGITRDTTKKSAQDLAKRGVDVVSVIPLMRVNTERYLTCVNLGQPRLRGFPYRCAQGLAHCLPRHQLLGDHERRRRILPGQECDRRLQGCWCFSPYLLFASPREGGEQGPSHQRSTLRQQGQRREVHPCFWT